MLLLMLAAATGACPFSSDRWIPIASKGELPSSAVTAIGEMADKGEPFQVSDALPPGPHPPFSRFVSAAGRGCDLTVSYEHGGIAHSWRSLHLRFNDGQWVALDR